MQAARQHSDQEPAELALEQDKPLCQRCAEPFEPRAKNQRFCCLGCRRMLTQRLKYPPCDRAPRWRGLAGTAGDRFAEAEAEGLRPTEIARRFGVSRQRVSAALTLRRARLRAV